MVKSSVRTQIRLCTASSVYSTAIMSQLSFGTFYPRIFEAQFAILGTLWILMFTLESNIIDRTEYGPHFVATRSFVGMNALFSIVAGEEITPVFTAYQYELTALLSGSLLATLLILAEVMR